MGSMLRVLACIYDHVHRLYGSPCEVVGFRMRLVWHVVRTSGGGTCASLVDATLRTVARAASLCSQFKGWRTPLPRTSTTQQCLQLSLCTTRWARATSSCWWERTPSWAGTTNRRFHFFASASPAATSAHEGSNLCAQLELLFKG